MDLLYSRYSNPLDLMYRYINQGRFGTFVDGFIQAEHKRMVDEATKDNEWKLWTMYIHSYSNENFEQWKKRCCGTANTKQQKGTDADLDDNGIKAIMTDLFPSMTPAG